MRMTFKYRSVATWARPATAFLLAMAAMMIGPTVIAQDTEWEWAEDGFNRAPTAREVEAFSIVVADLDKSIEFYRDVLGLRFIRSIRYVDDPDVAALYGSPSGTVEVAQFGVANEFYRLDLVHFPDVAGTPRQNEHNAPGSFILNFGYLRPDEVRARLHEYGATMVSGEPVPDQPIARGPLWVRGPDGEPLEIGGGGWDAQAKNLAGVDNLFRGHFVMNYSSEEQILDFYRDGLGFNLMSGFGRTSPVGLNKFSPSAREAGVEWVASSFLAKLANIPEGAVFTAVEGYCAGIRCEMFAFKSGLRPALNADATDPGAGYLKVVVDDIEAALSELEIDGDDIVTSGGQPVLHAGQRQILAKDPSGFMVMLTEEAQ